MIIPIAVMAKLQSTVISGQKAGNLKRMLYLSNGVNNTVPGVRHIKVDVEVENTGSGTYLIARDLMVYRQSYGWIDIHTFTMPSDGLYTIDCDIPNYNITKFAIVPSSNWAQAGHGRVGMTWSR